MKYFRILACVIMAGAFAVSCADACSVFKVTAKDGTIISGRTMEFGYDVKSAVAVVPRNKNFTSRTPQAGKGLTWKSKFGFVGISAFGDNDVIFDGMNETGLTFSALWYEPDMKWQDIVPGEEPLALAHTLLGSWILGNFSTVGEVRDGINKIKVFAQAVPDVGVAPVHLAVYDAQGGAIVIECDNGKMNVYDNPIGIMTNAPSFPWMLTNLRTYVGLSEAERPAVEYAGIKLNPTGHGNGMLGLPGDITPPNRFVRMAVTLHFADKPDDTEGAINLTEHILNSLDIVKGIAVDRGSDGKVIASETTQWATLRDITNKVFYFRTYEDLTLRKVDLKELDLTVSTAISMSGQGEVV